MWQFPDPKTTDPKERRLQRRLERVPGLLTWGTLLGMLVLSFFLPVWVAVFIILFDIYWIYRTVFITFYSLQAYARLQSGKRIDWLERATGLKDLEAYAALLRERLAKLHGERKALPFFALRLRRKFRQSIRRDERQLREVEALRARKDELLNPDDIIHIVMFPTAGEPADVIEPAIQALAENSFPRSQIIVLLATEEREPDETRLPKVKHLTERFAGVFRDFIVTTHQVAAGEMKCKASNAGYAARQVQAYLDERTIDYRRVIFSNFDCDSVAHREYFSALTYFYCTDPKRLQRAYQPLPVYHNNLWDVPAPVRIIVTGSSFWHMYQSTRREMVTFSSHSEAFDTLVRVGFWPVNMISEDSVIYWKCFSYYHGDYEVKPIPLPVSLDAVLAPTYWKTIQNQYKQKRRWAYGIENFPVTMRAIWPDRRIPLRDKLRVSFEMLEGHYSWATTSFILAFLGWLPLVLGGVAFRETVLANNLPFITEKLMQLAMAGLLISVPLSLISLPPRPRRYHWSRSFYMLFQWVLFPVVAFFSALPAIDSQTRLLLGKYFGEFWVTEKMRK